MARRVFILTLILSALLLGCSVDINPGTGGFSISDTKVDFGSVYIGDIKQHEITLKNPTSGEVKVNSVQLEGADWDNFFITSGGNYPFNVGARSEHSIILSFSPVSDGSKSATLKIGYGFNQFFEVKLSGSGKLVDGLMLLPSTYNFGELSIGETASVNITLNNGTDTAVTIASVDMQGSSTDDFTLIAGGGSSIFVDAYSVRVFTVQFSPISGGAKSANLHVAMDDGMTEFDSVLTGEGEMSVALEVTPPNYDYGEVGLYSTVEAFFTITNVGNSDVLLTNISIISDLYNNYKIKEGELENPITLSPMEQWVFSVTFTPLSNGKKTAKFSISFLATGSPLTGDLVGIGADQPTLSPDDHDFGSFGIGDTTAPFIFTFTNPTDSDINVTNIAITGTDASAFVSDPTGAGTWPVLANGGTLVIGVTFTPSKGGIHSATLNVTAGAVYQAELTGDGISIPSFSIDPTSYDFGSVITGSTDSKAFKVTNNGTGPLNISNVEFLNNGEGNFSVIGGATGIVDPGANHLIIIEFAPVTNGEKSSTMRVIHDAPGSPALISLMGEGSDVALTPGNIDFGSVEITTTSSPQTLTVRNSTSSPITITSITITGPDANRFNSNPSGNISQLVASSGGTYQFTVTCSPNVVGTINAVVSVKYGTYELNANLKAEGIERPVFSITPTSKDFGRVRLGSVAYQNFIVTNTGTGTLTLQSMSLLNNSGGDFAFVAGNGSLIDITTGSHTIRIAYKPQTFGNHSGALQIVHNGTGNPTSPVNVLLAGQGYGPEFNLIPDVSTYAFGDCYVGKQVEKRFYIANGGDETLIISSYQVSNSTDYALRGLSTPTSIPAGKSIAIFTLIFKPSKTGNIPATLTINHNSVNAPKTVSLTGTGLVASGSIHEDFESNPSSWGYNGNWEWGVPRNTTYPGSAHSGSRCFGTNIDGSYSRNQYCYLVSPMIDLSKAKSPYVSFYMYSYSYTGDGGWVEYSIDGGNTWSRSLNPQPAYNGNVNGGGGYTLDSGGWVEVTIDLAVAAGKNQVQLAWYFYSNNWNQSYGWYIDDVTVEDRALPYAYNPVPYDNDINVVPSSNRFTLKWDCDGANTYDVYLSQAYPPTNKIASGISTKSYQATVTSDKKYYWKVVANHSDGSKTSQVWYFETVSSVPKVLINECETRQTVDWVEFYNTEDKPVYIGGWVLTIYADNNSIPDGTFRFPIGTVLQPKSLVVVYDNQASGYTYITDFNIEWANATSPGEVIFTYPDDYGKPGVDYMKFNTLYNHKPSDLSWSGNLSSNNTGQSSFYRRSSTDTDNASDWSVRGVSPDKGVKNPGQ